MVPNAPAAVMVVVVLPLPSKIQAKEANLRHVKVMIQDKKVRLKIIFMLYIFLVAYPIDMYVCG